MLDDENLRDASDLKKYLSEVANLVLHGHTHQDGLFWLDAIVPILATGSAALKANNRPEEVGNQYQIIRLSRGGFERLTRRYDPKQKRWVGDTRCSSKGDSWQSTRVVAFRDVDATFPPAAQPFSAISPLGEASAQIVKVDAGIDAMSAREKLKSMSRFRRDRRSSIG